MPIRRPKKTDPLPVVLDRQRVYIFPTRQGFVFFMILFAMLAGSINYNNNLGFLLVFLLGGMSLVSMIHTYRNLLGLKILSVAARPVFAGEDADFALALRTGGQERRALSVSIGKHPEVIADIAPRSDRRVSVGIPAPRRGFLRPASFTISCIYPLGLFCAWSVLQPDVRCIVYPAPATGHVPVRDESPGEDSGSETSVRSAGVDDFRGLRTYEPGDSFRHISWKSLSRGQGALTKDFSGSKSPRSLVFDYSAIRGKDAEERLSMLCGMILEASRENRPYGLALPGITFQPDTGGVHRHRCLKELALFGKEERHG